VTIIARRFRGPTSSGNGGYTAGLLAAAMPDEVAVQVTLRRPPPLDVELALRATSGGWALYEREHLVAEAAPTRRPPEPVAPVDLDTARAAEAAYPGLREHPFPECFVCGPARSAGDGLRLSPGRLASGRTACTWTPDQSLADATDRVAQPYLWAALDCPGGWTDDLTGRPMVLGRITAAVLLTPRAGETCVVVAERRGAEGRKRYTASTVYDAQGQPCGSAEHTWIHVDPAQFR